jgi:glc operon protein GlcG
MRQKPSLTAADCQIIMTAAQAEAANNKWAVSIAIVDEAGILWRLERGDGAVLQSAEIAEGKAFTAAISRTATKALEDVVKDRPAVVMMPDRLAIQGGVPIMVNGECVGAVGVSGVKSPEDEQVAFAGVKAITG